MKVKQRFSLLLVLMTACTSGLAGYSPVIVAGAGGYLGQGSLDPASLVLAFGPQIDVDFRTTLGTQAYLAVWYSGDLWFSPGGPAPTDQQSVGALLGGPLRNLRLETRAAATLSTPLGDDQLTLSPEWALSLDVPLAARLGLEIDYSGFYNFEPDTTRGQLSNAAGIRVLFDPSIELGIRTGATASMAIYPDQFILDSSGTTTSASREDLGAEFMIGAEGLIGYFTFWTASATANLVRSNTNRYLSATGGLEEGTADRTRIGVDGTFSSNPVKSLGFQADIGAAGTFYPDRSSLDAAGDVVATSTTVRRISGSLSLDWNPFSRLYLIAGVGGLYASSDDAALSGWNYTGELGLQFRL